MSVASTQANPYVYLHTHVRDNGSVILDLSEGTANKFAQVDEDCRALRANPQEVFRQFVDRASNYVRLDWAWDPFLPDGDLRETPGLKLRMCIEPLKSPEATALLTHEFHKVVRTIDYPPRSLKRVKRVSVQHDVINLECSSNQILYHHPWSTGAAYLLAQFFYTGKTDHEIQQKIAELMQQTFLSANATKVNIWDLPEKFFNAYESSHFHVFFSEKICRSDGRFFKISDAGFVDRPLQNGKLTATFIVQSVEMSSPTSQDIETAFDLLTTMRIIAGAVDTVFRNLPGYQNVTLKTFAYNSFQRSPAALAITSGLVWILEPETILSKFAENHIKAEFSPKLLKLAPQFREQARLELIPHVKAMFRNKVIDLQRKRLSTAHAEGQDVSKLFAPTYLKILQEGTDKKDGT